MLDLVDTDNKRFSRDCHGSFVVCVKMVAAKVQKFGTNYASRRAGFARLSSAGTSIGFLILRPVCRSVVVLLISILSATLLLRLDSAIFGYRVLAVLRQTEKLKLGQTKQRGTDEQLDGYAVSGLRAGSEFLRMPD